MPGGADRRIRTSYGATALDVARSNAARLALKRHGRKKNIPIGTQPKAATPAEKQAAAAAQVALLAQLEEEEARAGQKTAKKTSKAKKKKKVTEKRSVAFARKFYQKENK